MLGGRSNHKEREGFAQKAPVDVIKERIEHSSALFGTFPSAEAVGAA
jgi:hypothetical protein